MLTFMSKRLVYVLLYVTVVGETNWLEFFFTALLSFTLSEDAAVQI